MKRLVSFTAAVLAAFVLYCGEAAAQDPVPKVINGGVLNSKAVSLPKPAYPVEAREAKAEGAVAVDVEIDENGEVVGAVAQWQDQAVKRAEDGSPLEIREVHPALRAAAEEAARAAKFSPTLLSGEPVRVKGRIVYNFVAGDGPMATKGRGINGGVLNGKAKTLPSAVYPAAALAVQAEGAVAVQITIDEQGRVVNAAAVSGHPLLRAAAVEAAKLATFAPTLLSGQPVKVSGVLTYNFVAQ